MDGHALGIAFDIDAGKNPNIKLEYFEGKGKKRVKKKDSYDYMLRKFGASTNPAEKSRATMDLGPKPKVSADKPIEALGKETAAQATGEKSPGLISAQAGNDLVDLVGKQFDEMFQTSERFKSNNSAIKDTLVGVRDTYFALQNEKAAFAAENKKLTPEAYAAQKLKADGFQGTKEEKLAKAKELVAEIKKTREETEKSFAARDAAIVDQLKDAFTGWDAAIQKDIEVDQAELDKNDASTTAMDTETSGLDAIDAKSATAMDDLQAFATQHQLKTAASQKTAKAFKTALQKELAGQQKTERDRIGMASDADLPTGVTKNTGSQYAKNEKAVLTRWQKRLTDPAIIFGKEGKGQVNGHATTKTEAETVSLMQLLEDGFIENEQTKGSAGAPAAVFNKEIVQTLVRFGFSPGATYGDTMHFDFIEGSSLAVKGGRNTQNMDPNRFGPQGLKNPKKKQ